MLTESSTKCYTRWTYQDKEPEVVVGEGEEIANIKDMDEVVEEDQPMLNRRMRL